MGSTRFPGKVVSDLQGTQLIKVIIKRLQKSSQLKNIILATTKNKEDDILCEIAKDLKIQFFRGETKDVLSRFVKAIAHTKFKHIIRITADCPFVDPYLIEKGISLYFENNAEYLSNAIKPTYPDGLDFEIFSKKALYKASKKCTDISLREHVTPWIRESGKIKIFSMTNRDNFSKIRVTVDYPEDLEVINNIIRQLKGDIYFDWEKIVSLYKLNKQLFDRNKNFYRNEGFLQNSGQKLWKRAKKVIPGGNMLLSKRPEMFVPDQWPAYYSKAKGCKVWDLDGNKLIDMSIMGIGTNILGYCNKKVDDAVKGVIKVGNMSTLNAPEEVILAEKLVELHPWSDMVRFARSGGEANAIAIRIARAATGRDTVAICGYHGWHDWYLATNLSNKSSLKEHLLPGLEPKGVPSNLLGTVKPFSYNNIEQLKEIVKTSQLAAIKMEVQRNMPPKDGFLENVRKICDENDIVLIFDECTSGFRETFGGLHKKYMINPDMAMFGKALGNGYAITAVVGKESVMQAAQSTFISSTFWTERIGPTAALSCLEEMRRVQSWKYITELGTFLQSSWKIIADRYSVPISISGLPALSSFSFVGDQNNIYKTYFTQEMLKRGYLAGTICFICTSHNEKILKKYLENFEEVFNNISQLKNSGNLDQFLDGPTCHSGFMRLN